MPAQQKVVRWSSNKEDKEEQRINISTPNTFPSWEKSAPELTVRIRVDLKKKSPWEELCQFDQNERLAYLTPKFLS